MGGLRSFLSDPVFPITWAVTSALALLVIAWDLKRRNDQLGGLMKLVWLLTTAYSGPIGLAVYFATGRRQIAQDSLWRKGFRSTAHCYSGCGLGEIVGVGIAVGLFSAGQTTVAVVTFALAYLFGLALTVGPLVHDGVPARRAFRDAVLSETASIVVMEAVAIGVDLAFAQRASGSEALFLVLPHGVADHGPLRGLPGQRRAHPLRREGGHAQPARRVSATAAAQSPSRDSSQSRSSLVGCFT